MERNFDNCHNNEISKKKRKHYELTRCTEIPQCSLCTLLIIWELNFRLCNWYRNRCYLSTKVFDTFTCELQKKLEVVRFHTHFFYSQEWKRINATHTGKTIFLFFFCLYYSLFVVFIIVVAWNIQKYSARTVIYGLVSGYNNNMWFIQLFQCYLKKTGE